MRPQPRSTLFADPSGRYVHDLVLESCRRFPARTAIVDASLPEPRRITYGEYGERVERIGRNLVAAGFRPGEVLAIYLPNSWEFAAAYHAATLAGLVPTPLNPSYREREVRYQLEASGAAALVTDAPVLQQTNLTGLPELRRLYMTRRMAGAAESFSELLRVSASPLPAPAESPGRTLAALPFSSGTTGLPKGVMLSHANLVTNVSQTIPAADLRGDEVGLGFLPLYHIYGLNVVLNPLLARGATLVLLPRFDAERALELIQREGITWVPMVPPVMSAFCQAAEQGRFPREHRVRRVKCGAAPLAPELARRFTSLTSVPVIQGYGMTEASPVTHIGTLEPYRPDSIGIPVAETDCRLLREDGTTSAPGEPGELVMRGPQFMMGYWRDRAVTDSVLRDGWYWSGDIAQVDEDGFYSIVDRRKEMIKYKGFPIAPAEVESVLLEHPTVRDAGVVGVADGDSGEIPCAFIVLRDGHPGSQRIGEELRGFVAERLTPYKQPRRVEFVANIPRNPSGKILRRELRKLL